MDKVNVGIIGAGYIGEVHASVLSRDERVRVSLIYDIARPRAELLAGSRGARAAESVEEIIEKCEAIYITTPNTRHVELAIAVADAGRHVFCEKPMATNLQDARVVLTAAEKSAGI